MLNKLRLWPFHNLSFRVDEGVWHNSKPPWITGMVQCIARDGEWHYYIANKGYCCYVRDGLLVIGFIGFDNH